MGHMCCEGSLIYQIGSITLNCTMYNGLSHGRLRQDTRFIT